MTLEELLEREGLDPDEAARLLSWAHGRAGEIVSELHADAELGPLLNGQAVAGPPVELPVTHIDGAPAAPYDVSDSYEPGSEVEAGAPQAQVGVPQPASEDGTPSRPPLPPIPSSQINVADLEASSDAPGLAEPESPDQSGEMLDLEDVELLDEEDLELIEEEPIHYGPPPGESDEPEWKAALDFAQGDDPRATEAAERVKATADSQVTRMPEPPRDEQLGADPHVGTPPDDDADLDFSDLD